MTNRVAKRATQPSQPLGFVVRHRRLAEVIGLGVLVLAAAWIVPRAATPDDDANETGPALALPLSEAPDGQRGAEKLTPEPISSPGVEPDRPPARDENDAPTEAVPAESSASVPPTTNALDTPPSPSPSPLPVPSPPTEWASITDPELERFSGDVSRATPAFQFDRVEKFTAAGTTRSVAVFLHLPTQLEFSLIPPGVVERAAQAGDPLTGTPAIEAVRYQVEQPFLLARTECTWAAWVHGDDLLAARYRADREMPVVDETPLSIANWLHRRGLRLPLQSEWEYACRAGATTRHWAGDDSRSVLAVDWLRENSKMRWHRVGALAPNAFGLHDLHGNVAELCLLPVGGGLSITRRAVRCGSAFFEGAHTVGRPIVEDLRWPSWAVAHSDRLPYTGFRPAASIGGE